MLRSYLAKKRLELFQQNLIILKQSRLISTSKAAKNESDITKETTESNGDSYFIPGKRGYSPQFSPPKGCLAVPKAKKPLKQPEQLPPSKLENYQLSEKERGTKAGYKKEMKKLRYQYYKEFVANEAIKDKNAKQTLKLEAEEKRKAREKRIEEQREYFEKVLKDPYSPFNVLNPEGTTILSKIPDKNLQEKAKVSSENVANSESGSTKQSENLETSVVGTNTKDVLVESKEVEDILLKRSKLRPPRVTVEYPEEENRIAKQLRKQRRDNFEREVSQRRQELLLELYHEAENFITYENMEEKISEFFSGSELVDFYDLPTLLDNLSTNGGVLTSTESAKRDMDFENALDGTVGPRHGVGLSDVLEYKKNHESQP
ncbi:hypothetical protein AX774_g6646 [Zancudomyces culisetae]|uniref:Uncharacterized protein n=1 Tax=Zancudomyces culisetae TaxID=1213189 RepID=A0A1R1PGF6_ZANCU|nr:hypothetical protein AX774_g6646 [Zancudomyces culisetae]|eukprot:OMH79932.1 hypothetical protein AX774_g6646 [Zancudomyces culisetae]